MTSDERRSGVSLALIYAFRMLGLFMVLPVFALEARHYPGGESSTAVGIALGAYGLVQAVLQIPFGMAADRWGRKRVIVLGLGLFALGSMVGVLAHNIWLLGLGRALQGGGAISAAVTALLADQTREGVRTKGMALIGASIGLSFALSLVVGPLLAAQGGLRLIFGVTAVLALLAIGVVLRITPAEPPLPALQGAERPGFVFLLTQADLFRLNLGVFMLYAVQIATWVALPGLLIQAGVAAQDQAWVYLPAVLLSFAVMGAGLFRLERKGWLKPVFLFSIVLVLGVELAWSALARDGHGALNAWSMGVLLLVFFCGFNVLEATQPSLASRWAPPGARGAALGVYNTLQSLGIFTGGALGGWMVQALGHSALFLVNGALLGVWLLAALHMPQVPGTRQDRQSDT